MLFDIKSIMPELKSESPYMNEPAFLQDYLTTRPITNYTNLDYWIERTPEAISILNAIASDIKADGFSFEGGKQAINKANVFCETQRFGDEWFKALWDWIKYGDCYIWIGGLTAFSQKKNEIRQKFGVDIVDEDLPTQMKYAPTTTMNIIHDGRKILKFRQSVQGREHIDYDVKEIIHGALLPNKGKVYGYSPSQACLTEMNIIGYLKDYAGTFFKNGGVPDYMFVLEEEMAGSPNHKKLVEMLQTYKHPLRKHGNLVFAGNVRAEPIGMALNKDMEFNNLAIYLTSVLALAHNMPISRVASVIGAKVKASTGGDDLANEGYWSKIAEHQDRWENWLNTQLFKPYFDVRIRFNRAWKVNEIKEQQRNQFAIANITSLNNEMSMRWNKQLTLDYVKKVLYLKDSDLEEGKPTTMQLAGPNNQNQMDNTEIEKGAGTESYRNQKRKQVSPTQDVSGYGK